MPDWMKNKLESRLPGEIQVTSDMQMIYPYAESEEELKSLLLKVKEENEKAGLKLSIQEVILRWWRNRKGRLLSPYKFIKRTVER